MLGPTLIALCLSAPGMEQLKVHARADWPFAAGAREFVVRSPSDLVLAIKARKGDDAEAKAVADVTRALKVKDIDWQKQMLVVVRLDSVHPTYRGNIHHVEFKGKGAIVHYSYYLPAAARPQDKSPTPIAYSFMALVDRCDGEIQFKADERLPK